MTKLEMTMKSLGIITKYECDCHSGEIITHPMFWECECEKDFIHHKTEKRCISCKANADEQSDARIEDVFRYIMNHSSKNFKVS